jgi:hypothetical protein
VAAVLLLRLLPGPVLLQLLEALQLVEALRLVEQVAPVPLLVPRRDHREVVCLVRHSHLSH